MKRNRILSAIGALICAMGLTAPAAAAEVACDSVYCFSTGDFSDEEALAGICITSLPDSETGTVFLGTRILHTGDILTAEQLAQMTFQPLRTETDCEAVIGYLPIYADRVETAAVMTVTVLGKQDFAPVAEDFTMETYKNLPNEGQLKVKDPEGESLTYTIVRQPRRGEVTVRDDGSFIYVPKKNKVGVDSFSYTATDPAGNVSREATVTITILKPTDASQYSDTEGRSCRFAAEWMKNTGIFVGETLGGNGCFQPDRETTQAEFLTMLVNALELQTDADSVYTGLDEEYPDWLKPYLTAALRSGLLAGLPEEFAADEPITGAEAAVLLQNALDLSESDNAAQTSAETDTDSVPAWAAQQLTVLAENGIVLSPDENLTRGDAAEILYTVSKLKDDAPGARALYAVQ